MKSLNKLKLVCAAKPPFITLTIRGGSHVTPAELGVTLSDLIKRNMQPDEITLQKTLMSESDTIGLEWLDQVEVYVDHVRVFQGLAQVPQRSEDSRLTESVQILGGWWHLTRSLFTRRLPYSHPGPVSDGGTVVGSDIPYFAGLKIWANTGFISAVDTQTYEAGLAYSVSGSAVTFDRGGYQSSKGELFYRTYEYVGGGYFLQVLPLHYEVNSVLASWRSSYISFGNTPPLDTPEMVDIVAAVSSPDAVYPRSITVQDSTCADVLTQVLAVRPTASMPAIYSAATPTFGLTSKANAPLLEVSESLLNRRLSRNISVRKDLIPSGVVVRYEAATEDWLDAVPLKGHALPARVDKAPSTAQPDEPGSVVMSVPPSDHHSAQTANPIAAAVWAELNELGHSGSASFACGSAVEADEFRIGSLLSWQDLAGQGFIQETRWDLSRSRITLRVGYPAPLGLERTLDLQRWIKESLNLGRTR